MSLKHMRPVRKVFPARRRSGGSQIPPPEPSQISQSLPTPAGSVWLTPLAQDPQAGSHIQSSWPAPGWVSRITRQLLEVRIPPRPSRPRDVGSWAQGLEPVFTHAHGDPEAVSRTLGLKMPAGGPSSNLAAAHEWPLTVSFFLLKTGMATVVSSARLSACGWRTVMGGGRQNRVCRWGPKSQ